MMPAPQDTTVKKLVLGTTDWFYTIILWILVSCKDIVCLFGGEGVLKVRVAQGVIQAGTATGSSSSFLMSHVAVRPAAALPPGSSTVSVRACSTSLDSLYSSLVSSGIEWDFNIDLLI